ncbi:hypothetical protein KU735_22835, partial [Salmonella enterica subsp. enterica serovar Give]|nr:hypothetical protein [Salmonella enterica subsp. enterica serovar Give]
YIGNLGRELSLPAASLTLVDKLAMMEQYIGKKVIDAVVVGPRIMEEINQTHFTGIMENILLKKEVSSLMSAYWR